MYKFNFHFRDSIIRLVLSGTITIDLVEKIAFDLYVNSPNKDILLLTDVRGVKFDFNCEDIDGLIGLTNKYVKPNRIIHEAIVIDSPREIAISMLFDSEHKRENHFLRVFSTESAAIDWLLLYQKQ